MFDILKIHVTFAAGDTEWINFTSSTVVNYLDNAVKFSAAVMLFIFIFKSEVLASEQL